MTADQIIDICEAKWDAEKSDCSGFLKAVAGALSVNLVGLADNIYDEIHGPEWTELTDGADAAAKANAGLFVVAALKGSMNQPPEIHGHVCVVVATPELDPTHHLYPRAYWGRLGGVGQKNQFLNFAWNAASLPQVYYASTDTVAVARQPITIQVDGAAIPTAEGFLLDGKGAFGWIRPIADALNAELGDLEGDQLSVTYKNSEREITVNLQDGQSFVELGDLRTFPTLDIEFDGVVMTVNIITGD